VGNNAAHREAAACGIAQGCCSPAARWVPVHEVSPWMVCSVQLAGGGDRVMAPQCSPGVGYVFVCVGAPSYGWGSGPIPKLLSHNA
jgi:hypothetical protein